MGKQYARFWCPTCHAGRRFYPDYERECFEWVCGKCGGLLSGSPLYANLIALKPDPKEGSTSR